MAKAPIRLDLPRHTPDTAPEEVRETLRARERELGMLPNIYGYFANAPGLLNAYLAADEEFRKNTALSPVEQEVVMLTISRENGCTYCVSVHSWLADNFAKVPTEITDAIRERREIPDSRLEALSRFTQHMLESRGLPSAGAARYRSQSLYGRLESTCRTISWALRTWSFSRMRARCTSTVRTLSPRS